MPAVTLKTYNTVTLALGTPQQLLTPGPGHYYLNILNLGPALVGGSLLGYGAQQGIKAAGAAPEYQELGGDVGNILGGGLAANWASGTALPNVKLTPEQAAAISGPAPLPEETPEAGWAGSGTPGL
jgi:hypothetical protein